MFRFRPAILTGLVLLIPVLGCTTQTAPLATPPATATPTVQFTEITTAGLDQAIREQQGKVVLIDVWFLSCDPCRKRFPHLVAMSKELAPKGLVCFTLDVEKADLNRQEKVKAFLTSQEATFPNFIFNDDKAATNRWREQNGAKYTPGVVIFDRKGNRIPVEDDTPLEQVETLVRKLLTDPAA